MQPEIRTVIVTRYVTPLREGGSLPAIVEADDGFLYVLKFRGAGQGIKALIAELIGGELARLVGLKLPEIVFAELNEAYGRAEGDEEIQDLLKFSTGLNLGMHYLSGAVTYDPAVVKTGRTAGFQNRMAGCVFDECRSYSAQYQHVALAKRTLADRSWRRLVFSSQLGKLEGAKRQAFYPNQRPCAIAAGFAIEEVDQSMKKLLNKEVIDSIVA
jgi:hypothetical protein